MLRIYEVGRKEVMIKFVAVILFFCFAECAAGSCLNYGHACWGAHGKRSGNPNLPRESNENPSSLKTRWFLSKLIQGPLDFRYLRDNDLDIVAKHNADPLFVEEETDSSNGQQWHTNQNLFSDDQLFDDNFLNRADSNRIRIPKVLDKRSTKQN